VSTADRTTPGRAQAAAGAGEPTVRVPGSWTARFTLLWLGFWMAGLVPIQLVLPNQFAAVDAANKVRDFGITNGAAWLVALITLPLAGALCDHTRSRLGRRRVWMAAGVVVFAVSVAVTGLQGSWVGVMVCRLFASLGFSMASAGLFAAVAGQVPVEQRGIISGAIFGPQALGRLVGLVLLTQAITSNSGGYLVLTVALVILAVPFVLRCREALVPQSRLPLAVRGLAEAMWVSPRAYPDFAWAFGGRVMVNIGNALAPRTCCTSSPTTCTCTTRTTRCSSHCDLSRVHAGDDLRRRVAVGPVGAARVFVVVASVLQVRGPGARHPGAAGRGVAGQGPRDHEHRH
jgi:MFS family permease